MKYQDERKARRRGRELEVAALLGDGLTQKQVKAVFEQAGESVTKGYISQLAKKFTDAPYSDYRMETDTQSVSKLEEKKFTEPTSTDSKTKTDTQSVSKLVNKPSTEKSQQARKFTEDPLYKRRASSHVRTTIRVRVPIVKDDDVSVWEKETGLRNWVKKSVVFDGVTVVKNTRCVELFFYQREFGRDPRFKELVEAELYTLEMDVARWLEKEKHILVDLSEATVSWAEYANPMPELDETADPSKMHREYLGYRADTSHGPADFEAQAWCDRSWNMFETESNCLEYEQKVIYAPIYIHELYQLLPWLSENLRSHQGVLDKMQTTLVAIEGGMSQQGAAKSQQQAEVHPSEARVDSADELSSIDFPTLARIREYWRKIRGDYKE